MDKISKQIKSIRIIAALSSFFDLMNKISSIALAAVTLKSVLKTSVFFINKTKKSG